MKILILDPPGSGLDFAMRCQARGHDVRLCTGFGKNREPSKVGEGLVAKVLKWEPSMHWADLVVMTDNSKWMWDIQPYHDKGFPIIGTTMQQAELENDREFGQQMLRACGVKTLPAESFTDYNKCEQFVRREMRAFVSKPNGAHEDKSLSYVSKSPADMIYMIRRWKASKKKFHKWILQDFMPGIEMSVSGWFGRDGWVGPWCEQFEHKKLGNDNTGPNTGEMGTALKYVERSPLADLLLAPLTTMLAGMKYRGCIDVSAIIDKRGTPWPLEFTARLGWPAFQMVQEVHPEPVQWMYDMLHGRDTFKPRMDTVIGVVVAIPDFPYSHLTQKEVVGVPIYGVNESNLEHIHPCDIMAGRVPCMDSDKVCEKNILVSAGDYLLVCSGRGESVSDAKCMAYKYLEQVEIPNSPIYRTDIGDRLEHELPVLKELGFARSWKW